MAVPFREAYVYGGLSVSKFCLSSSYDQSIAAAATKQSTQSCIVETAEENMMGTPTRAKASLAGLFMLGWAVSSGHASAQADNERAPRIQVGRYHSRHRLHPLTMGSEPRKAGAVAYRGLTIKKPFSDDQDGEQGYADDTDRVRYNDIRTFVPNPYTDSGQQFPFGLDGVGGYGSDLGFDAGQDSALYKRAP